MKGLSAKEMEMVSFLEMNEISFFSRGDIGKFFRNGNEMAVYLHRLARKGRIVKLNRSKYYLIPVRAFRGSWAEHPFVISDEMFNGRDYCIFGMAAANYWGLIEQLPTKIEICCIGKQGGRKIFGTDFIFKRRRKLPELVERKIKDHPFKIITKKEVEKWLKSR